MQKAALAETLILLHFYFFWEWDDENCERDCWFVDEAIRILMIDLQYPESRLTDPVSLSLDELAGVVFYSQ